MFSILFQQTGPLVVAEPTGQGGLTVIRLSRKAGDLGTVQVSWKVHVGKLFFLLQFLSRHWHPQMQSPTLHSVYLSIVSRRTETAWFWMAANIKDKNNSAAVHVGSSLTVHNPFFFFTNCDRINLFSGFIGQKDLEKNNRNVKWPFRTKASKGKLIWMIVHLFHESLLHFIKSFSGEWSLLWEFVKSLECQIYFL